MTFTDSPLVSICIPSYLGAAFLSATINSVLQQSYQNFELWIIDDNSPDNTEEVVSSYSDGRIHFLRNMENLGPEANWNRCLQLAKGEYFKLLPQDDLLEPDCLQAQIAIFEADTAKDIALVFGSRHIINSKGRSFMTRRYPNSYEGRIRGLDVVRCCIRAGSNLIGEPGNGLIRRELINKVGLYDGTNPYLIDLDFWFRVLTYGDAYYLAKYTSSFRVSQGSWSVLIGDKQYLDFRNFVGRVSKNSKFGITRSDVIAGLIKAKLNSIGRMFLYRLLSLKIM
jgi:glycosyltransferase involved in cell wall biosynthesis